MKTAIKAILAGLAGGVVVLGSGAAMAGLTPSAAPCDQHGAAACSAAAPSGTIPALDSAQPQPIDTAVVPSGGGSVEEHAIKTKGAGSQDPVMAPTQDHAIKTKGAGANDKTAAPACDHAIKTKGAVDAMAAPANCHAINTKVAGGV